MSPQNERGEFESRALRWRVGIDGGWVDGVDRRWMCPGDQFVAVGFFRMADDCPLF